MADKIAKTQLVQTLSTVVVQQTGLVTCNLEGVCPDRSCSPLTFCKHTNINKQHVQYGIVCIHQMNQLNARNGLPWWQRHKYHPGCYYFNTQGSKDPGWKRKNKNKTKCWIAIGPVSQQSVSCKSTELKRWIATEMRCNKYAVSLASPDLSLIQRPRSESTISIDAPRFSTAMRSNRYVEKSDKYFSVFLVATMSATVPALVAALSM